MYIWFYLYNMVIFHSYLSLPEAQRVLYMVGTSNPLAGSQCLWPCTPSFGRPLREIPSSIGRTNMAMSPWDWDGFIGLNHMEKLDMSGIRDGFIELNRHSENEKPKKDFVDWTIQKKLDWTIQKWNLTLHTPWIPPSKCGISQECGI